MLQNLHLLYISSIVPRQGTGGWIVLERHLRRLEASNWKISLVVPEQCIAENSFPKSWQIISIPMRRWWWPPVKPGIPGFLELRLRLWRLESEGIFMRERPSAILTILWDYYSLFAALLSRTWKIPLSVIVHDQWEMRAASESERRLIQKHSQIILNQAARVWPVSPEMSNTCQVMATTKMSVLYPIPEGNNQGFAEWKENFKTHPVIAHAGSLYSFHVPYLQIIAAALEKVDGTLSLVTHKSNSALLELLKTCSNVKHQEQFPKNKDVINFLKKNASCILVCYPFDLNQHPWEITSFPSRLIEFIHLGLPVIILAPLNTALSNWSKKHQWHSYLSQINEQEILKLIRQITDKATWMKMAEQSQRVAKNEFNPDLIQAQFESELALKKFDKYKIYDVSATELSK